MEPLREITKEYLEPERIRDLYDSLYRQNPPVLAPEKRLEDKKNLIRLVVKDYQEAAKHFIVPGGGIEILYPSVRSPGILARLNFRLTGDEIYIIDDNIKEKDTIIVRTYYGKQKTSSEYKHLFKESAIVPAGQVLIEDFDEETCDDVIEGLQAELTYDIYKILSKEGSTDWETIEKILKCEFANPTDISIFAYGDFMSGDSEHYEKLKSLFPNFKPYILPIDKPYITIDEIGPQRYTYFRNIIESSAVKQFENFLKNFEKHGGKISAKEVQAICSILEQCDSHEKHRDIKRQILLKREISH